MAACSSAIPSTAARIHFLQICPRSREEVDEYRTLRAELDRLTGRINGRFSEFDWTPLRYSTRPAPRATLAGLYRIGRIGVVTPLRDGMNLVAKEFVAAQPDDDPGVLVLSQFAGAAHELTEALIVNPFDPDAIADAMHAALNMPLAERRERHVALKAKVFRTTASAYCQRFLDALHAPALKHCSAAYGPNRSVGRGPSWRLTTMPREPMSIISRLCIPAIVPCATSGSRSDR